MPFSEAQIMQAIEQGLRRTSTFCNPRVERIRCQDVVWYGLSANTFARCDATIIADGKEHQVELVIKRWAPGGPTDVDMGIDPLPRESLAFAAGIFSRDSMPRQVDVPFIAALGDPGADDNWMILRNVSAELMAFRSPSEVPEIRRNYSVALDRLALMHATWEKPDFQARLKKLSWLVPDVARLSRGEVVARYVEGLLLSESELARIERIRDWIQGARIQSAREAFYKTLSDSDAAMWKRHECSRKALIAAFADFPTTLVHGDFWPLNIGMRVVDGEDTVTLIDWEWIGNGCGSLDVARLLSVGAASEYADFDSQGLADTYFDRYVAHGGTLFDFTTWQQAYELAEVYHAPIVHPLATGWSILDGSAQRTCHESRTPRLAELIVKHLG